MAAGPGVSGGGNPPSDIRGQHHRNLEARPLTWKTDGELNGDGAEMDAIVSGARSRSTVLTGAAGLLLLVTAVLMMVCAAPRIHQVRPASVTDDRLASWVWVTHDHWMPVTPGAVSKLTRTDLAPVP